MKQRGSGHSSGRRLPKKITSGSRKARGCRHAQNLGPNSVQPLSNNLRTAFQVQNRFHPVNGFAVQSCRALMKTSGPALFAWTRRLTEGSMEAWSWFHQRYGVAILR